MARSEQQDRLELDAERPLDDPQAWQRDDPDEEPPPDDTAEDNAGENAAPSATTSPEGRAMHVEDDGSA